MVAAAGLFFAAEASGSGLPPAVMACHPGTARITRIAAHSNVGRRICRNLVEAVRVMTGGRRGMLAFRGERFGASGRTVCQKSDVRQNRVVRPTRSAKGEPGEMLVLLSAFR